MDWKQSPIAGIRDDGRGDFDKEHYLDLVDPTVSLVSGSLSVIAEALQKWQWGGGVESNFLLETKSARQKISVAYDSHASSPEPPYECHDLYVQVGSMLACMHNIVLYHNVRGIELWNDHVRRRMTASALDDAINWLNRIMYEREKVS